MKRPFLSSLASGGKETASRLSAEAASSLLKLELVVVLQLAGLAVKVALDNDEIFALLLFLAFFVLRHVSSDRMHDCSTTKVRYPYDRRAGRPKPVRFGPGPSGPKDLVSPFGLHAWTYLATIWPLTGQALKKKA